MHIPFGGIAWWSKNLLYETPYSVTGTFKLSGSEQKPTDICTDRIIGTREAAELLNNKLTKKISS